MNNNKLEKKKARDIIVNSGLLLGRHLSTDKKVYQLTHPNSSFSFNANIIIKSLGKVWYGDINFTEDYELLYNVCKALGEDIYILTEKDGRYVKTGDDIGLLMAKAITVIHAPIKKKSEIISFCRKIYLSLFK
jgi:hypothetical protein